MSRASSGSRAPSTTTSAGATLAPPAASTQAVRAEPEGDAHRHVGPLAGGGGRAVVDVDVAVDAGHADGPDGVAQARQRAGDQRAAAPDQQRPRAAGDGRRAPPRGRSPSSRACRRCRSRRCRIALLAADPHVEVAAVLGAEAARAGRARAPPRARARSRRRGRRSRSERRWRPTERTRAKAIAGRAGVSRCASPPGRRSGPRRAPPGGCEPAGRLVHTTVGVGERTARPARASCGGGHRLGGAERRAGRGDRGEDLVGVEAAVVPDDQAGPARGREIGDHPVAAGGRDVLRGAEARRRVGRRHPHAGVGAVEAGPGDGRVAALRRRARSAPGCGSSRRARGAGRRGSGGPTGARRPR